MKPHSLDLGTGWRRVMSFTPRPGLFPEKEAVCISCRGGGVLPTAGLDDVKNRTFLALPGIELRSFGRADAYRLRYLGSLCWIMS
jgi:hypothetical protein